MHTASAHTICNTKIIGVRMIIENVTFAKLFAANLQFSGIRFRNMFIKVICSKIEWYEVHNDMPYSDLPIISNKLI